MCSEFFCFVHVPSINVEEVGFGTYTASSYQGAIIPLWLVFKGCSHVSHLCVQNVWHILNFLSVFVFFLPVLPWSRRREVR